MAESLNSFLEKQVKPVAIPRLEEDILLCVTPKDHVVACTREMETMSTGHSQNLAQLCNFASLTPTPLTPTPPFASKQTRELKDVNLFVQIYPCVVM